MQKIVEPASFGTMTIIDPDRAAMSIDSLIGAEAARAVHAFLCKTVGRYPVATARVYGSRARRTHVADSDVDVAVILRGEAGDRYEVAGGMAELAFDVMLETGFMIDPLPLWEAELERPELFHNPALIAHIERDGWSL